MYETILDWLGLLARWVHVLAAIMWVGDSFLFMWMDSHLRPASRPREGTVVGELWMVHSGGFYEVVKRRSLAKEEIPEQLHWFKWESYTTWLSGFVLLVVVHYLGGGAMLVDANGALSHGQAVFASLSILAAAVLVYDTLWLKLGPTRPALAKWISIGLVGALVALCSHLFPGRAAFLQVGATLGTVMAANVFFRIIPAQRAMLRQTYAGEPVDTTPGLRAKQRSTHNHYLSLPVLFTMLSNHFPMTFAGPHAAWVLALLIIFGASFKYFMNFRLAGDRWVLGVGVASLAGAVALSLAGQPQAQALDFSKADPVPFDRVHSIVATRCTTCHAEHPTNPSFAQAPKGVMLDTPERIALQSQPILKWAVNSHAMPLGNITGMLEEERFTVGAWIAQGSKLPEGTTASGGDEVKAFFEARCATCHGSGGKGNGPAGVALMPRPRNFTDHAWQQSVDDDRLRKVIVEGGTSVGLSAMMLANPDLAERAALRDGLVRLIRSFDSSR